MKSPSERFESLDLAMLDNKFVSHSLHLQSMQPPRQQVGLEHSQSPELHCQILLLTVVIPLLGIQKNLLLLLSFACQRGLFLRTMEEMRLRSLWPERNQRSHGLSQVKTIDNFLYF